MITIQTISPDSFASNCYLLAKGEDAFVVDPGVSLASIQAALDAQGAVCRGILLTHGHFDHMLSLDELRAAYPDAPVYLHADDAELLSDGEKNAFALFFGQDRVWRPADHLLLGGEMLPFADEHIKVIHTPGHTQGSVCYLCGDLLITGDTLFDGGYGRCDLYGGDWASLTRTLRRLTELPVTLRIYPGHGPSTTLGDSLSDIGLV